MEIKIENLKKTFYSLKWYEFVMMAIMIGVAGYVLIDGYIHPGSSHNPDWLNVINFISAVAGVICIFFTARASISACVFGIINTVVYIVYLQYWHIYGTMCLELMVYLPVSIAQWFVWADNRDRKQDELTLTKRLTYFQLSAVFVCVVMCGLA